MAASPLRATDLTVNGTLFVGDGATIGNLTVDGALNINGSWFGGSEIYSGSGSDYNYYLSFGTISGNSVYFNSTAVDYWIPNDGDFVVGGGLSFGSWWNGTDYWDGALFSFLDLGNETSSNVTFIASSPGNSWIWQENAAVYGGTTNQMLIDGNGNLTLTDSTSGNFFSLNPGNFIVSLGQNNTVSLVHGLQSLNIGSGSIFLDPTMQAITVGSVIMSNNGTTALNFFDTSFLNSISMNPTSLSIAFSNGFYLSANYSGYVSLLFGGAGLAIANNATASGYGALAMGNSTATGDYSFAVGNGSITGGDYAIALDGGNATGTASLAIGLGTSAQTSNTTVIGRYNVPISSTGNASLDPTFIVGIGNSTTAANGLLVYNNGNTTINGNTTLVNSAYVSPTSGTQPLELQVSTDAVFNGNATLAGNITVTQVQGDIPVGEYDSSNSY